MSNPAIEPAPANPFLQHLDGLVDELRLRVSPALEAFDVESVHKARVTTRRLKAAMDLLEVILEKHTGKPLAKLGRKLRRRLGPLRDADVMLEHLDEIYEESPDLGAGCEWLKARLIVDREDARAKSRKQSSAVKVITKLGAWEAMRSKLLDVQAAIPSLLAESTHQQLDQFIDQANQLRARLHKEDVDDPVQTKHDPHQLRIAGKSLRYTLELAEANGQELPEGVLKTFKKMQEALGAWHDFVVLGERAMKACLEVDLPLHDPLTQRQVLKLIDHAMTEAQDELEGFADLWEQKGQELSQNIRNAFVLTTPGQPPGSGQSTDATGSQTDPDPSHLPQSADPQDASPAPPPAA